ncbi:uncharacterized protein LOC120768553 [Bactrocera tryoni]|uniref:uncharacterized protein LOC120768553 n=1 Tax=Bactrocera tryoni TaxID=59916 RepID=UPI001A95CC72|nr:uncharacterized protein LOC120768553 [Bactrocera tryoni]
MTAYSFKLPLCMLLLTTLLQTTATTSEETQQKRDYRITRRFIEIGSEQAYIVEPRQKAPELIEKEEWNIKSEWEKSKKEKAGRDELYQNAEKAAKKVGSMDKSHREIKEHVLAEKESAMSFSKDRNQSDVKKLRKNLASVKTITLPTFSKKQINPAATQNNLKLDGKALTSAPTLHTLNSPTNHIRAAPSTQRVAPRFKRQQAASSLKTQQSAFQGGLTAYSSAGNTAVHYNPLPAVPLPPPPPFPGNFAISPFSGGAKQTTSGHNILNAFAFAGIGSSSSAVSHHARSNSLCGGVLKSRYGNIQTPNFPHKFPTPIECVWVIDASELPITTSTSASAGASGGGGGTNISIIVYLTQLYVLGGLKFTEYMYYSDDYKVPAHRVFTLTEDDVTQVAWVQFSSQYLEIRFTMPSLDGTHLRALDRLLDVYGFNITYEVQQEVKTYQCNTLQCRFLGHCYAKADYSSYYCSCFPGFSGTDCGRGPLCEDPHTNICQNGGTCKHIGDAAITCHCPSGFKGTKCEIPEINEMTLGCTSNSTSSDCHKECDFERGGEGITLRKASKISARNGKTRYEVTIRLGANLTAFYRNMDPERRPSDHLPSLLERHLMRVLRNFNITKISDLELISNSTDRLDITFHFFGVKGDSNRIREAITRMVERGRIGNITLVSNYHLFDENPPLNLLELTINQKSAIREDSEFIISCTAQGSSRMQFQWYKDGARVNTSKAIREIWTTVLPPETKDTFTAILGITKASRMDEGIYTCKVTDWSIEQCRSLHVHIKTPPRLRVDPASVTLQRGDSLRVRCLSPGNDDIKRYAQLGYSWTRNGVLFQSNPATVMWEDLYPDGSILKINNIQKSAEYTCIVSNTVRPVSKSVYITVIDRNAVRVCHSDTLYGVRWPTSAPGAAIVADCPRGFEGHSRRICESRDTGNSTWLLPDFALCVHDQLLLIYNKFRALSAGYQQTNSSAILKACFAYTAKRHKRFLPGEAGFLIDMLHEVDTYLQLKGTQLEREMAAEIILHILDKVMQNTQSLNSQQQIKKLQLLTQSAALNRETIAASQLATSTSSTSAAAAAAAAAAATADNSAISSASASGTSASVATAQTEITSGAATAAGNAMSPARSSATATNSALATLLRNDGATLGGGGSGNAVGSSSILTVDEDSLSLDRLNSLRIYMTSVKTLPFNLRIYGDDLFADQLYMDIGLSNRLLNIMANSTIFASVISYKNLKSFLPKTYYTRGSDPKESDYILASRILQTWLFQSNRSNDNLREPLDLPFEAGHVEIIFQHEVAPKEGDWVAVCGHDYKASFESTWRSDLCITKHLMANITRCICPLSGTYVVMLTKRNNNSQPVSHTQRPLFVIISCACGLLQSCSAFLILLPIWFNRKCAITFLKMQFCISTSSIMIIFLLGFLKMLPENWQAVVNSSLASLLLLGVSTTIAIALVVNSELVPKKMLHINKMSTATAASARATTIKKEQQQRNQHKQQQQTHHKLQHDLNMRHNSTSGNDNGSGAPMAAASPATTIDAHSLSATTNITQISSNSNNTSVGVNVGGSFALGGSNDNSIASDSIATASGRRAGSVSGAATARSVALVQELYFPVSVRAVIGISWLPPLLYAIAVPLICSIIGKWPRNWWLEVMSNTTAGVATTATSAAMSSAMFGMPHGLSHAYGGGYSGGSDYLVAHMAPTPSPASSLSLKVEPSHVSNQSNDVYSVLASTTSDSILELASVTAAEITTAATGILTTASAVTATSTNSANNNNNNVTTAASSASTSASTASTSTTFSVAGWHNNFQPAAISASATAAAYHGDYAAYTDSDAAELESQFTGDASSVPSLSFIIFICVDLLFVLLFFALFVILIKKLLWLWHKNRNIHAHPQDKFNVAMRRRIGLIYRTGCLLLMKLSTDALFIAYVNSTQNSWWSYPFGISCVLLGFSILYCFVIKAESSLRAPPSSINSSSGTLKKKLSSSKTSLDDNYCTGSINSPLSFYASHEKEKENGSGAPVTTLLAAPPPPPQQLEISGGVQLPLTIIPTAQQRCPLLPTASASTVGSSVKTFLNAASLERKLPPHVSCLQETAAAAMTSPATRCCNILGSVGGGGGSGSNAAATVTSTGVVGGGVVVTTGGMGYYDAYGAGIQLGGMTGSLNRRQLHGAAASTEFVGLETLDILQGVAPPDTIIGICGSALPAGMSYHQLQHHSLPRHHTTTLQQHLTANATGQQHVAQHHQTYMDATMLPPPPTIVSISSGLPLPTTMNYAKSSVEATATTPQQQPQTPPTTLTSIISTTTATTQTPKAQKRVTIMEPTTHTFDPLLPTMVAVSGVAATPAAHHRLVTATPTPIITITSNTAAAAITVSDCHASNLSASDSTQSGSGDASKAAESNSSPEDENSMTGMLDRITHDLDYLLNRTNDVPPSDATLGDAEVLAVAVAAPAVATSASTAAAPTIPMSQDTLDQL